MADRRAELAAIYDEMADMLSILGENSHRVMAYRRGAESLRALGEPLEQVIAAGRLEDIPGIGAILAAKAAEYIQTGALAAYTELQQQVPPGVLQLLKVPNIGPRKAAQLWQTLGIASVSELEAAAEAGKIRQLKGFGVRSEHNIREGIRNLRRQQEGRVPLGVAWPLAADIMTALESLPQVKRIAPAGSLRRMREAVHDLDILVAAEDAPPVMTCFCALPLVEEVLLSGPTKTAIRTADGIQVDLRVLSPQRWGAALQYFTGSQAHNIRVRGLAQSQGLSLSEYGFRRADGVEILCAEEEGVYANLNLPWIPPELREDRGEFEAAQNGSLPHLVQRRQLLGDFQCHTLRSDGEQSLGEMARAAYAAGLHYIVVTDHAAGFKGGWMPDQVGSLLAEVARVNTTFAGDFRVLAGLEVDILPDGALSWPDAALAQLDFVVASLHSGLTQPCAEITARLLKAMQNPYVDLIAHPTGRKLGGREANGADLDMEAVFLAAARYGVALEINARPNRLDLSDVHVRRALALDVPLAISTASHDADGLATLAFGVAVARRGWAEARHLLNTRPAGAVLDWSRRRRQARLATAV